MNVLVYVSNMVGYGAVNPVTGIWDPWDTETWGSSNQGGVFQAGVPVGGVYEVELQRMSNAHSSSVQIKIAGALLPVEYGQRILVTHQGSWSLGSLVNVTLDVTNNVDFVGRVDEIKPSYDTVRGQIWTVRARDYLGVLQDNHVEPHGKSRWMRAQNLGPTFADLGPLPDYTAASDWTPNWNAPDASHPTLANTSGFTFDRAQVCAELIMNTVDLPTGIRWVDITSTADAPYAGGVDLYGRAFKGAVFDNGVSDKTIADAVRDILADDPWIIAPAVADIGSVAYPNLQGSPPNIFGNPGGVLAYPTMQPTVSALLSAPASGFIPGIGDDLVIDYNPPIGATLYGNSLTTPTPGTGTVTYTNKQVRYAMPYAKIFPRGLLNFDPAITFTYGQASQSGNTFNYPVMSYEFPKEGQRLKTRSRVIGRAENSDTQRKWPANFIKQASTLTASPDLLGGGSFTPVSPDYAGGAGSIIWNNDDEVAWNPQQEQFAVRRTATLNDEAHVGFNQVDWLQAAAPGGAPVIDPTTYDDPANMANELRATSGIFSKTIGTLRDLQRGTITVPGLPRNTHGEPLVPGCVIGVNIPPLFTGLVYYIVDSYTYTYPDDQTVIQLARRPYDETQEAFRTLREQNYSAASHGKSMFDSGWIVSSANLTTTVTHNFGQRPTAIIVTCAQQAVRSGGAAAVDSNGNPVPVPGTETMMPSPTFDQNNGAWVGGFVSAASDQMIVVSYSGNMAYSSAAQAGWLLAGTDLIRIQIRG